jgi:hypothetical protein
MAMEIAVVAVHIPQTDWQRPHGDAGTKSDLTVFFSFCLLAHPGKVGIHMRHACVLTLNLIIQQVHTSGCMAQSLM